MTGNSPLIYQSILLDFRKMYTRTLCTHSGGRFTKMLTPRTVGLIVIGNEILSGKTEEINSRLVCRTAPLLGLRVNKVSIIPDDVQLIAKETREFMHKYDVVLTSGGIGSTHDDVTFEGLAKALNQKTVLHPELLRVVEHFFGHDGSLTPGDPRTRLTRVPESAELVYGIDYSTGRKCSYPVIKIKNIYVLPGVPRHFQTSFEIIKDELRDPGIQFLNRLLFVNVDELKIAQFLSHLALKYGDSVAIGSYPSYKNSYYRVCVTFDSVDEKCLQAAYQEATNYLQHDIVEYEPDPVRVAAEAVYSLTRSNDSVFANRVSNAIQIIESMFERYSPEQFVISFNGGKDCTALLHLVYAVWCHRYGQQTNNHVDSKPPFPPFLYIRSGSVFPELEHFVHQTVHFYHLPDTVTVGSRVNGCKRGVEKHASLIIYEGSIKSSLERFVKDYPEIRAVFMGTRSSDPYSAKLSPVCMTDPDWPQILRVNPILDWSHADVWRLIRQLSLPYCTLYDVGYTSIGNVEDTRPNPQLRVVTECGRVEYRPAYTLSDPEAERRGRENR